MEPDKALVGLTKAEFEAALRAYFEDGGHSYDRWDLAWAWGAYQQNPANYDYIVPFIQRA
ncbi:hypothetical protein [Candidimonas nitroreducens]|uniref:Uncharacterized protein n=1 Tax=Candidimonas nitroreducens TaxID=683354 RepID=A0A225M4T3_9BURK|nr:hypothetical protein [Candidimonas nitroreducens]OWT55253.1 hypothetical protein CEY11_21320 [Candidimonas nitroreducens]